MTNVAANAQVLVIDAMCLSHFARAERFDVFRDLLVDKECWTTRVVLEEVRQGAAGYPALEVVFDADWLSVVELDSLDEIRRFAIWVQRLGSGERDLGEASVLAAAEPRNATSIIDDREAVRVARTHGAEVHGTLWLLGGACNEGKLANAAAASLIDALRATGLRLPCTGAEFSRPRTPAQAPVATSIPLIGRPGRPLSWQHSRCPDGTVLEILGPGGTHRSPEREPEGSVSGSRRRS